MMSLFEGFFIICLGMHICGITSLCWEVVEDYNNVKRRRNHNLFAMRSSLADSRKVEDPCYAIPPGFRNLRKSHFQGDFNTFVPEYWPDNWLEERLRLSRQEKLALAQFEFGKNFHELVVASEGRMFEKLRSFLTKEETEQGIRTFIRFFKGSKYLSFLLDEYAEFISRMPWYNKEEWDEENGKLLFFNLLVDLQGALKPIVPLQNFIHVAEDKKVAHTNFPTSVAKDQIFIQEMASQAQGELFQCNPQLVELVEEQKKILQEQNLERNKENLKG